MHESSTTASGLQLAVAAASMVNIALGAVDKALAKLKATGRMTEAQKWPHTRGRRRLAADSPRPPKNRYWRGGQPRFSGVGTLLLASAIQLSIDEEFAGRIGLHSLPQADAWYVKCGLTDLGPDPNEKQNLKYFEMTPERAKAFLG